MLKAGVANYMVFVQNTKPWTPEAPHDFAPHMHFGMIIFVASLIAGLTMVLYSARKLKNRKKIGEVARSLL